MIRRTVKLSNRPEKATIMQDVLEDVLNLLRLKSSVYCRSEIGTQDWSMCFHATRCPVFHVVEQGECWLHLPETGDMIHLREHDLLVLPHGHTHHISQQPGLAPMVTIQLDEHYAAGCHLRRYGESGEMTTLVCGIFDFEHRQRYPLIEFMPALLHIDLEDAHTVGLDMIVRLIGTEAGSDHPGTQTLLKRLADVLFVQVVRLWMNAAGQDMRGWLRALGDPQIGLALRLMHQSPETGWQVEHLAREVAMSRSAFAARFTELVGDSPLRYLTRWRMRLAMGWLEDEALSVAQIALRTGYESEAAFHKAFRRETGVTPGHYRKQHGMPQIS